MKRRQSPCDALHQTLITVPSFQQSGQHALLREPSHLDHGFHGTPWSARVQQTIVALDNIHNAQIEIWTEPPIQLYLRFTVLAALLDVREVQEAEVDGLADLVGEISC